MVIHLIINIRLRVGPLELDGAYEPPRDLGKSQILTLRVWMGLSCADPPSSQVKLMLPVHGAHPEDQGGSRPGGEGGA